MRLVRDLVDLPKAHLHLHLEGSARLGTITDLAARNGAALDVDELMTFSTLAELIACYKLAQSAVSRPEDIERLAYELLVDEAAQGVRWCEPTVTPFGFADLFGSADVAWDAMRRGFDRAAAETGIAWGVIVGHIRTHPVERAALIATWAAERADEGVVGFGIAGDEQLVGPEPFAEAFAIAAEAGLLLVPHAGETAGPESVRGALALGAHRLAHGVRSVEDPELVRRLADEGITCDVCPTSNLKLSVVPSLADHPLPILLEAGVPVSLGTDDQLFFGSLLVDEYLVVRDAFTLSDAELAAIARTSVTASGAPAGLKADLLTEIDAWLGASP
jgi:adenosine deaminase